MPAARGSAPSTLARLPAALAMRHFEAIVESSDDAIISKTLDGIVTSWNRAAERMFGYRADEMIGQPMTTVFPVDRLDEEPALLARIALGERIEHFETVRQRKDGTLIHLSVTLSPIVDEQGRVIGASKIARDIGERIEAERLIWLQAHYDALTQLPNRRLFIERLCDELKRADAHQRLAVMYIDLDRFKEVNDTLGHEAGDELLVQAADRIKACLRDNDTVARMGGDEFTVLLSGECQPSDTRRVAQRLSHTLQKPFQLRREAVQISGSIGVAEYPDDGDSADDLLRRADQAMYESKRGGRNQVQHFNQAIEATARRRHLLVADLRQVAERQELELHYQPVVDLHTGQVRRLEALLRWRHPTLGLLQPRQFIDIAEECGAIDAIGDWVFRRAAQTAKVWQERHDPALQVAINLSAVQLRGERFNVKAWASYLDGLGIAGRSIVIEVTERVMVDPSEHTAMLLRGLRAAGMAVAVDDFGVGYSCLAYLNRMDVNILKIDQSFVRQLSADSRELALCGAIIAMAHALGLEVTAEGVETDEQRRLLVELGCDSAQGYLWSAPVPAQAIGGFMPAGPIAQRA